MKEELFIITDAGRVQLDLNTPSGITLNFKSNILGDFSNITCSHSYTFKLPMTNHNRSVLDMADDIRHHSGMIRKKVAAEFVFDGVTMFTDANLYIDTIEGAYRAAMTWNVVRGLQSIKDNNCKLNELQSLTQDAMVDFGGDDNETIALMSNEDMALKPIYNSGIPYYVYDEDWVYEGLPYSRVQSYWTEDPSAPGNYGGFVPYPLPVTPVRYLIDRINQQFGTNIEFGERFPFSRLIDDDHPYTPDRYDLINRGVLPLVDKNMNEDQLNQRSFSFTPEILLATMEQIRTTLGFKENESHIASLIKMNNIQSTPAICPVKAESLQIGDNTYLGLSLNSTVVGVDYTLYGFIEATFPDYLTDETREDLPTLTIYQHKSIATKTGRHLESELVEIASLEGVFKESRENTTKTFLFDFRKVFTEGISITGLQRNSTISGGGRPGGGGFVPFNAVLLFAFNYQATNLDTNSTRMEIIPDYGTCIKPHKMDFISNLPDISVIDFVKSLYYMLGAFPTVAQNGAIIPVFFSDLRDNKARALDWSKKVMSSTSLPDKISFEVGGFGQKNAYSMANDGKDEGKDTTDVYANGTGYIEVKNQTIDESKKIIQLPYNAPYIHNRRTPMLKTGSTFKAWSFEGKEFEFHNPDPIMGLISTKEITVTTITTSRAPIETETKKIFVMDCWNEFADLMSNPSYAYLQEVMNNPYVITEYLNLNEFDLRDLDFSVPVYLDKYAAYFAVVNIQRDGKGRCKCELLKLP